MWCVSVQEESLKVRAETKLDINLERSRTSDMVSVCPVYSHMMFVPAVRPQFLFFCQFTDQEKKLMEASSEFHHKVINTAANINTVYTYSS